jgi:uncharacterized protein
MSTYFNVSQLLKSDIGDSRSYEFASEGSLDLDESAASSITGHVKFTLTNFGILAAVQAQAKLQLTCARCLEPFETITTITFDEEYQPIIDIASGLPTREPRSDTASMISSNHIIDLNEAIRQNLLLALELVPLCRPDCRGLCPNCGSNRNIEQCACPTVEESSPFAVLQGLLSRTDATNS